MAEEEKVQEHDGWDSRKVIFAVAVELVATVAMFLGKMTADEWVGFTNVNAMVFAAGSVAEKFRPQLRK